MRLLVSVRSVQEAVAALDGGADLIDIKEPQRGALGRADDKVIASIVAAVGGRRPVSAAMGELREADNWQAPITQLKYVKFGLALCGEYLWRERLLKLRSLGGPTVVPTAYADWQCAQAPRVDDVVAFVAEHQFPVLLIDTHEKDGRNLFSWLSPDSLRQSISFLRASGCDVALAGSLSARDLDAIAELQPAWLAVRGAACANGDRKSGIDVERVRGLKVAIDSLACAAGS